MARGSNLQLGSCTTFPVEGSHSDALRFGCFTTTQYICNQFNNVLQLNHVGFEARFNPNLACNPELQVKDSSGVLNESMKILSEYTNEDHLSQRFGSTRPAELYVRNVCPSGTISVEECCGGDCSKPIGLCLTNDKLDTKTLCSNAYESAIRRDGSKRRSGSSILKSYNSPNDRRIDTTLVPQSKSILSGVGCRDGECIKIPDLYTYLQSNREVDYVFYPFDDQIFNKLTLGNINLPEGQTPREHFIKMYTESGHGINRPMNIEEIFNAHSDDRNTNLTQNDIALMVSTYEVEATFKNKNFLTSEYAGETDPSFCANTTTDYRSCLDCVDETPFVSECMSGIKKSRCYYKYFNGQSPFCDQVTQNCETVAAGTPESRCYPNNSTQVLPQTDNCICDVARSIETQEIRVYFPKVSSPTNENVLILTVPKGTEDFVARKLGGSRVSSQSFKRIVKEDPDRIINRVVSSRELQLTSTATGLCILSDGTSINTDVLLCDSLGGSFRQNSSDDQEFLKSYKSSKKINKAISYDYRPNDPVNEPVILETTYLPPDIPDPSGWPNVDPSGHRGPPSTRYTRQINSCCNEGCLECLFLAMREVEVGTWDDDDGPSTPDSFGCGKDRNGQIDCENRPVATPESLPDPCECPDEWRDDDDNFNDLSCCGCNVESYVDCRNTPKDERDTENCPSCGQHQIKRGFFRDAGEVCNRVPVCCVLENMDWRKELCEPCLNLKNDDGDVVLPCKGPCVRCDENNVCEVIAPSQPLFPDDPTNLGNRRNKDSQFSTTCDECEQLGGQCECYSATDVEQSVKDCCKRKREIGELAKRCYYRRYTRNGVCQQGTGDGFENGVNPDCKYLNPDGGCFSCLDIAAMHNGGPCGHKSSDPDVRENVAEYKERIKQALCDIGGGCELCIEIRVENCTPLYPDPQNPARPLNPQPPLNPLGTVPPSFWPPQYPNEYKKPRYFTPAFIPFGDDDFCPEEIPPIDDDVRADRSDNWSNLPGAIPQAPASEGANIPAFRSDGPYAVYGTGKAGGQGFYYPMYLTAIAAYAANMSGFDRIEKRTGKKDGLLYHTHRLQEYPDVVFYMPDDQMNHGVSDDGGYNRYRGAGPSSSVRSTQSPVSRQQSQTSTYTPPSSPSTPSAPPPPSGGGGGGYGGGY